MKRPPRGGLFALSLSQLNDTAKGLWGNYNRELERLPLLNIKHLLTV